MSSIRNITQLLQQPVAPIPAPAPAPAAQATIIASSAASTVLDRVNLTSMQAEQQALQPKTPIANPEILGTGTFSLFTVGNVLYTRQTERTQDGSVRITYVPKYPGISSGSGGLDITA